VYYTTRLAEEPATPASPHFRVRVIRPTIPLDLDHVVARLLPLLTNQKAKVGAEVVIPNRRERLACLLGKVVAAAAAGKDRFFHLEFERGQGAPRLLGHPPRIVWKTVTGILTHPASFGDAVPDRTVLENLIALDQAIFEARAWVNQQAIMSGETGWSAGIRPASRAAFEFLQRSERDPANIYFCYKGGGPG
jgi:hypothetical protein